MKAQSVLCNLDKKRLNSNWLEIPVFTIDSG